MTVSLNPYLHLDGGARDALAFYAGIFGGTPDMLTYAAMGMEGEHGEWLMHGYLGTPDGMQLMVSDQLPGEEVAVGDGPRIALSGDEPERLHGWFAALSEGGEVHVPLERQMWGDVFGQVRDRFGTVWLVNIADASAE